ncbi:hypothetical protein EG68_11855, partial [Paragonimus skrjabini miyazakii]
QSKLESAHGLNLICITPCCCVFSTVLVCDYCWNPLLRKNAVPRCLHVALRLVHDYDGQPE